MRFKNIEQKDKELMKMIMDDLVNSMCNISSQSDNDNFEQHYTLFTLLQIIREFKDQSLFSQIGDKLHILIGKLIEWSIESGLDL